MTATGATSTQTTDDASDLVRCDVHERVATLTLNRPDKLNALTAPMQQRYRELLDVCEADPEVRAIVVTGAGRGFCAGADLGLLEDISAAPPGAGEATTTLSDVVGGEVAEERRARQVTHALSLGTPVVAAVNGPCAGLGLAYALCCDIRFAAAGAKITAAFSQRGLIAEWGSAALLPRLVGTANALDLLLSSRVIVAEEALTMGLVQRVLPAEELLGATQEYAAQLAATCSPASMAIIKRQVYAEQIRDPFSAEQRSIELMLRSFSAPDFGEGVRSFLDHRPPAFAPYTGGHPFGPEWDDAG